jgi:hypothetical protein
MPLLSTTGGASSRAFGFGVSAGAETLELLASVTVTSTAPVSYDLLFSGSQYKSIVFSGTAKSGDATNRSINVRLLYGGTPSLLSGTQSMRTNPFVHNWSIATGGFTPHLPSSASDSPEGFTMFIGAIDQTEKDKPVLSMAMHTFSTSPGSQMWSPGRVARVGATPVSGLRVEASHGFSIGSNFKLYGIKAA